MIHPGLCSITFREHSPRQIVEMVAEAGLAGIEWGGDIHCPHGDVAVAKEVGAMTLDAGLAVSSYGSYFRPGAAEGKDSPPFKAVLDSAVAMGAPLIRIWAGGLASDAPEADEAYRAAVADETRRISRDAEEEAGIGIALECHAGSLTDTLQSTLRLLAAVDDDNVTCYFQPPFGSAKPDNMTAIEALASKLSNVHVFHWLQTPADKIDHRPLAEGRDDWLAYLAEIEAVPGDRWALLEFVRDGSEDAFFDDAATLKRWLS
ncbi:MAG: sugar phosphate isomerase/epimerase family protein [Planctomycetota bacterium]|jgi:sugar phosphate isomerase/epimerase